MEYNQPSEIVKDINFGDLANERVVAGVKKLAKAAQLQCTTIRTSMLREKNSGNVWTEPGTGNQVMKEPEPEEPDTRTEPVEP